MIHVNEGLDQYAEHYGLRDDLVAALRSDLLGPLGGNEEVLEDDAPVTVYPVGVLFPQRAAGRHAEGLSDDEATIDGQDSSPLTRRGDREEGEIDLGVSLANRRKPSSMGLTFAVELDAASEVTVHVRTAVYEPRDEEGRPVTVERSEARTTKDQRERWVRRALDLESRSLDVARPGSLRMSWADAPGLELHARVREPVGTPRRVTVTVSLVNALTVGPYDLQDARCYFQPELEVVAPEGTTPFVERPAESGAVDVEQATSRLLHRHAPSFASGHGCSAYWDWQPPAPGASTTGPTAVSSVRTEFVPTHEVLLTDSNPRIDDSALRMLALAEGSNDYVVGALRALVSDYAAWIETQEDVARRLVDADHVSVAQKQLRSCRIACRRMERGVELLADSGRPRIMEAFRAANKSMAHQRARSAWIKSGRTGQPDHEQLAAGKWRPFQISFILLCLEGIVDPDSDDRSVADLLWFPTGGGKTEAYLGLIAFTVFLRRLHRQSENDGVTVLMRYTLRLLTLQQFQRAAALICAMERERAAAPQSFGSKTISVGMWVGRSATPNTLAEASESLRVLRSGRPVQEMNPVQLHSCPWCGSALDAHDYEVYEDQARMAVRCPSPTCEYHEGLPVHLIDETVYAERPTLVIATVDKFAAMPWRPQTAALFNREPDDGTPPPELVVQDELHLISGPLGTLTGLYESVVDHLSEHPKIIASTATIRRAVDQGGRLFHRSVQQFPPAGLDARDSWFAVESPREQKASRRYVGVLTPSTSQATLLVRTYAILLHHAMRSGADDSVKDAYWTLLGYFNSLRLLAAAELQVLDDVQDRLEYLARRDGLDVAAARRVSELTELTSRADSSDIPLRLRQVERALPHPETLDVLLATNMISVGVDIDRLGLMAVMGQPQTTAEYIQATSRVGRRTPGLVVTMLNSARSRDRSHYESFLHFHSALYREVESTSVTPFSAGARDRGLHAVVVALARLLIPELRENDRAGRIAEHRSELESIVEAALLHRVEKVDKGEAKATRHAVAEFLDWWCDEADLKPGLVYEAHRRSRQPALLSGFADDEGAQGWPTLWSLRDVDAESALFLEASK